MLDQYGGIEVVANGLELTLQMPIANLIIYGDSQLIVKQLLYNVKKAELTRYHKRAKNFLPQFREVKILQVFRATNARIKALTRLTTSHSVPAGEVPYIVVSGRRPLNVVSKWLQNSSKIGESHLWVFLNMADF